MQEFYITIKQATELLMKCNHDFRTMISELLCVKDGKIVMKNFASKLLLPQRNESKKKDDSKDQKLNYKSSFTLSELKKRSSSNPTQERLGVTHNIDNPDEIEFKQNF
jgi:hypothetical protein